jgi:hypothetical protein
VGVGVEALSLLVEMQLLGILDEAGQDFLLE